MAPREEAAAENNGPTEAVAGMLGLRHSVSYVITEADVAFTQRSGGVKVRAVLPVPVP
jgi:hypothetical protein